MSWNDSILPWLRLIRADVLLSLLGEPVAGACVASALLQVDVPVWRLLSVIGCVFCLFSYCMIQNDICKYYEDLRQRPQRPLPSRQIMKGTAVCVTLLCLVGALGISWFNGHHCFALTAVSAGVITITNLLWRYSNFACALGWGMCRGINFLLGASLAGMHLKVVFPVVCLGVFVLLVESMRRNVHRRMIPNGFVFVPALLLLLGLFLGVFYAPFSISSLAMLEYFGFVLTAVVICLGCGAIIYNRSIQQSEMRQSCTYFMLALLPWQASWCMFSWSEHFIGLVLGIFLIGVSCFLLHQVTRFK